tara:strand:+ start:1042 stop:1221 length:180 start_codon:yes stop_codon:yes gene_type:complete
MSSDRLAVSAGLVGLVFFVLLVLVKPFIPVLFYGAIGSLAIGIGAFFWPVLNPKQPRLK